MSNIFEEVGKEVQLFQFILRRPEEISFINGIGLCVI